MSRAADLRARADARIASEAFDHTFFVTLFNRAVRLCEESLEHAVMNNPVEKDGSIQTNIIKISSGITGVEIPAIYRRKLLASLAEAYSDLNFKMCDANELWFRLSF